jgi:hypothetical protein
MIVQDKPSKSVDMIRGYTTPCFLPLWATLLPYRRGDIDTPIKIGAPGPNLSAAGPFFVASSQLDAHTPTMTAHAREKPATEPVGLVCEKRATGAGLEVVMAWTREQWRTPTSWDEVCRRAAGRKKYNQ